MTEYVKVHMQCHIFCLLVDQELIYGFQMYVSINASVCVCLR